MKRPKSSRQWYQRHVRDSFVKQANEQGYRSRASFKLIEINQKENLFFPGARVVDLGAAPGGWSQVAAQGVGRTGTVVALDLLPMVPLEGVEFIQGDLKEAQTLSRLLEVLSDHKADLVISDMAPNISGIKTVDIARSCYLAELALDLARQALKEKGSFLVKLFQGAGIDDFRAQLLQFFREVKFKKPKASREASKEIYLLAKGYSGFSRYTDSGT